MESYREKIEALNPQLITSRPELAKGNRDLLKSIVALSATAAEFDPGAYEAALNRLSEASKRHRAATETAFSSYDIPSVLSEAWRDFIVAGDEYLKDLGLEDYPRKGEKCLYCRQELGAAAVAVLRQYQDYCNNPLKKAVDVARAEATAMVADLRAINLPAFQQGVRNKLQQFEGNGEAPPVYVTADEFAAVLAPVLESAKQFERISSSTISDRASELKKLSVSALKEAEASIVTLQQQSKEREAARTEAEQNLRDIEDRLTLRQLLSRIRWAVEGAKWAERAKKITTKRFPPLKRSLTVSLPSENVLNVPSRNVLLTESSGRVSRRELPVPTGEMRPPIVALAQPKASAPRLHQSNPSHKHRRGGELAEWVSRTHSQRDAQPPGASPRPSSQRAKTGLFYSATNRTFLLGVDKKKPHRPDENRIGRPP